MKMPPPDTNWFKCGNDVHASIRKAERERVLKEIEAWDDTWHDDLDSNAQEELHRLIARLRGE